MNHAPQQQSHQALGQQMALRPQQIVYEISEQPVSQSQQMAYQSVQESQRQKAYHQGQKAQNQRSEAETRGQIRLQPMNEINKKDKITKYLSHHRISYDSSSNKKDCNLEDQLSSILHQEERHKVSEEFILKFNSKPSQAIQAFLAKIRKEKLKNQQDKENNDEGNVREKQGKHERNTSIQVKQNDRTKKKSLISLLQHKNQQTIVAKYLISMQGIDKSVLGEYFGKNNEKVIKILHEFCNSLDFKDMEYDLALRKLLSRFRLPGQSQQIQRIIWQFSLSFFQQNKTSFDNPDELFPLAYSIIMLATDAHNPKQQRKMTMQEFVRNTNGPCPSIKKEYLEQIYLRITKDKLQTQNNVGEIIYARLRDMKTLPTIMDELANTKDLKEGTVLLKICRDNTKLPCTDPRQSKFVQRKVYLSDDEKRICWVDFPGNQGEEPRFIEIKDIIDLTLGIAPHLKKNNKVPVQFDSLCFTITTYYRYLDLKAKDTKERSQWLNFLRAVMIKRRQEKKIQFEKTQEQNLPQKALQQAWNGDVFPNWDQYWDYELKKPKRKSYFRRGLEAICGCFQSNTENNQNEIEGSGQRLGFRIRNNLLQTLWKYGLPSSTRKILWIQIISNPLELNKIMIDDIQKRRIYNDKLRSIKKKSKNINNLESLTKTQKEKFWKSKEESFEEEVYEITQFVLTLRPDLPPVRDLIMMSSVFYEVIEERRAKLIQSGPVARLQQKSKPAVRNFNDAVSVEQLQENKTSRKTSTLSNFAQKMILNSTRGLNFRHNQNSRICLANLIHKHHFLSFYRGEMQEIEGRTKLFEFLLQKNAKAVLDHFKAIKLQTRMYLVTWFLSVFAMSFSGEFLYRIWDNFLLQEELYLFKVGITIVKYFEIELKMCTFSQGLDLLKQPPTPSAALFFHILQNQINVTSDHYNFYIQKRKHAMIKTKVQSIPLQ